MIAKDKIISRMYSAPNKILYALFKPVDDEYDANVIMIEQNLKGFDNDINLSKQDVELALSNAAVNICLSVYDNIAFFGANPDTLMLLNAKTPNNSTGKIANLLMEENGGGTARFVDKAIKLKEDERNGFITHLIQLIARKHILTHDVDYKVLDQLTSKVFKPAERKNLTYLNISRTNKKE